MTAGWLWLLAVPLLPLALLAGYAWRPLRPRIAALAPWAALPALAAPFAPDLHLAVPGLMIDSALALDATGRLFLSFTALIWWLAGLYGRGYLAGDEGGERFYGFWLATLAGSLGLIVAADALTFYAFFTIMGFAAYGLIVHDGSHYARRAGRVYLIFVVIGEILLFAGLALRVAGAEGTDFAAFAVVPPTPLAAGLLLAAFAVKAGALPLHMWLPLAHPAAPTPASAVLSGVMIKAGLLGWLRFLPPEAAAGPGIGTVVVAAGLAAALLGIVAGLAQEKPKALLAYSSISQMGLITALFGAGLLAPDRWPVVLPALLLFTLHHALAKGALFMAAGIINREGGRTLTLLLTALPAAALAGLPFTSGAAAKAAFKAGAGLLPGGWPDALALLLPLSSFATALLMVRLLFLLARCRGEGRAPPTMRLAWLVLVLLGPIAAWYRPEAAAAALTPAALWGALWPVVVALIVAWLVLRPGRRTGLRPPAIPEGDLWPLVEAAAGGAGRQLRRLRPPTARAAAARAGAAALAWSARVERAEAVVRSGPVAGLLFIALLLLVAAGLWEFWP